LEGVPALNDGAEGGGGRENAFEGCEVAFPVGIEDWKSAKSSSSSFPRREAAGVDDEGKEDRGGGARTEVIAVVFDSPFAMIGVCDRGGCADNIVGTDP
jgi:hypothetical protein